MPRSTVDPSDAFSALHWLPLLPAARRRCRCLFAALALTNTPPPLAPDTIDLQASTAPTTQRHPRAAPDGSIAPHQAETLREVAAESAEENLRSPRISWVPDSDDIQQHALALDSTNPFDPAPAAAAAAPDPRTAASSDSKMRGGVQQDALAIAQNGGLSGTEADDADLEADPEVDMDDDMMDKISSSPSIEDGGSTSALPALPPSNPDHSPQDLPAVLPSSPTAAAVDNNVCDTRSSSPYLESPDHLPLRSGAPEGVPPAATLPFLAHSPGRYHHHRHHNRRDGEYETSSTTEDEAPGETCRTARALDFNNDNSSL